MKSKALRYLILIISFICVLTAMLAVSLAYFSSDVAVGGYASLKIELLFDKYEQDYLEDVYQAQFENLTEEDKVWGHKGNPYVISEARHVANLSVLQNIGYFYGNFIEKNYNEAGELVGNANYSDGYDVPYFVISKPNGNPVVVDVGDRKIKPVGNDEYPFIGSVMGITAVAPHASFTANGSLKSSTTSGIHNVTVQTEKSTLDYGFFGRISYLGEEIEVNDEMQFTGFVSTISNILFSDVKIKASSTDWTSAEELMLSHFFYKDTGGVSEERDPCETHHIGIVAGHAEYAKMSAISVYYSSDNVVAIDIQDVSKEGDEKAFSYVSSTGHIGLMYNLNPVTDGVFITAGSGLDSADISYGYQGGGGISSGVLPGYIRADEMHELYGYYAVNNNGTTTYEKQTGDLYLINAYAYEDGAGIPLVTPVTTTNSNTNYYFTDGVFTFALSGGQNPNASNPEQTLDSIESIWKGNYVDDIQLSSNGWDLTEEEKQYYQYKILEPITQLDQLNTTDKYYIGHIDEHGAFSFMDLTNNGSSVKAIPASCELRRSADGTFFGLRYKDKDIRGRDEEYYALTISKIGTRNNAQGDALKTFRFTSTKTGFSLGITKFLIFYGITCQEIPADEIDVDSNTYDLVLEPVSEDGSWKFQRLDVERKDNYQGIGLSGNSFSTDWWGGSNSTPIYIYRLTDDVNDVEETPLSYAPNSEDFKLPANQYVFVPTYAEGEIPSGGKTKTATTYEVKALGDLGWRDGHGSLLWQENKASINKMFNIKQAVDWDLAFNIGNFSWNSSSSGGTVLAPVGSGAYQKEIYVPTGSLAFYINKVPASGSAKIRVIVKIPQSDGVRQLGLDSDPNSPDHYIGLWKGKERNSSSWFNYSYFSQEDAYQKVELPRSHPLVSAGVKQHYTNGDVSTANETLTVKYGDATYTTMLQGGHYLLAYEFSVTDTGTYIIAATEKIRMQIAYCSVDGVASSGRDGSGGSLLGNIDFVYDNANADGAQVLLVTDGGTTKEGKEDPSQYYYESYVLVYFANADSDNNKHIINGEVLSIYRWTGGEGEIKTNVDINYETTSTDCKQSNCKHIKCVPIKSVSDNITINGEKQEE